MCQLKENILMNIFGNYLKSDFCSDPVSTDPERGRSANRRITRRLLSQKSEAMVYPKARDKMKI